MLLRSLLLCLLLSTAACSKPVEGPSAATPPSAPMSEAAPAVSAEAAPAAAPATPAAAAPVAETATPKPAESAAPAAATDATLQDSDYQVIADGKPYGTAAGKVEVVEFFNYVCPACNAFEPLMQAWKAKLPADVQVIYVPADFRGDFAQYARAYYAADLLGIAGKTHAAVYQAVHETHTLPGEGPTPDVAVIAKFYAQHGVTAQAFTDAMSSFAVNTRMNQGHQFEVQSRLASTPSLLINGRYMAKGKTFEDKLRIASLLIERERKQGTGKK